MIDTTIQVFGQSVTEPGIDRQYNEFHEALARFHELHGTVNQTQLKICSVTGWRIEVYETHVLAIHEFNQRAMAYERDKIPSFVADLLCGCDDDDGASAADA